MVPSMLPSPNIIDWLIKSYSDSSHICLGQNAWEAHALGFGLHFWNGKKTSVASASGSEVQVESNSGFCQCANDNFANFRWQIRIDHWCFLILQWQKNMDIKIGNKSGLNIGAFQFYYDKRTWTLRLETNPNWTWHGFLELICTVIVQGHILCNIERMNESGVATETTMDTQNRDAMELFNWMLPCCKSGLVKNRLNWMVFQQHQTHYLSMEIPKPGGGTHPD